MIDADNLKRIRRDIEEGAKIEPRHLYPQGVPEKKHTHQHDIPVEWFTEREDNRILEHYVRSKVTKLRCACGDEVER